MSEMGEVWQVAFVDLMLLFLVASLGLWFRSWLVRERNLLSDRFQALEVHQLAIERLTAQLRATCEQLERLVGEGLAAPGAIEPGVGGRPAKGRSSGRPGGPGASAEPVQAGRSDRTERDRTERERRYERARELLSQGQQPATVARQLGLGMAEVELMDRISQHKNTG